MACFTDVTSPHPLISLSATADVTEARAREPGSLHGAECQAQQKWLLETQNPQRSFLGDSVLLEVCGGRQEKL